MGQLFIFLQLTCIMKKILITGTTSGIGYGLAKELLSQDNRVYGLGRREATDFQSNPNYKHLQIDLTDYPKVENELPGFIEEINHFDLVILNSGILGEIKWMSEVGVDEMKRVMEINVMANKVFLDIVLKLKTASQVVGMSSKASLRSTPGWGPYCLSKAGLNMLMNIYAKEYPDTHFSSFAPGLVDSEIQEAIYQIKETEKYPSVGRLQEARYTDEMPDAISVAPKLLWGMEKALELESGGFLDVRDIEQ